MECCAWCKKKKGLLESFTKNGYCQACETRIRDDITALKRGMDMLLAEATRCTDSREKNRLFEKLKTLYDALSVYKERQVSFFKSDIDAPRKAIVLAINNIPDSIPMSKNISPSSQPSEEAKNYITQSNSMETSQLQATAETDLASVAVAMQYAYMQQDIDIKQQQLEIQQQALQVQQEQLNAQAKCPRCGSTSLSGNKKGYGVGKAAVGVFIAGPVGLLAGGIGSGKVKVTCLKCGHKFYP